jgi:hypothetical protein
MRVGNLSQNCFDKLAMCDKRLATCDVVAGATCDKRLATCGRQSTLRRAMWLLVRRATRDVRRATRVRQSTLRRAMWWLVRRATSDERRATRVRQSTLRHAMWWLVRRATSDVRRACDNRRFDARREEQPFSKSNILSEHGQHYLPSWGKERLSKPHCAKTQLCFGLCPKEMRQEL